MTRRSRWFHAARMLVMAIPLIWPVPLHAGGGYEQQALEIQNLTTLVLYRHRTGVPFGLRLMDLIERRVRDRVCTSAVEARAMLEWVRTELAASPPSTTGPLPRPCNIVAARMIPEMQTKGEIGVSLKIVGLRCTEYQETIFAQSMEAREDVIATPESVISEYSKRMGSVGPGASESRTWGKSYPNSLRINRNRMKFTVMRCEDGTEQMEAVLLGAVMIDR